MKLKRKRQSWTARTPIILDPDADEVDARYESENVAVVQMKNAALSYWEIQEYAGLDKARLSGSLAQ